MGPEWASIASGTGGVVATLVAVIGALYAGKLFAPATLDAWKGRALRAEANEDSMLPVLREQTVTIRELRDTVATLTTTVKDLVAAQKGGR